MICVYIIDILKAQKCLGLKQKTQQLRPDIKSMRKGTPIIERGASMNLRMGAWVRYIIFKQITGLLKLSSIALHLRTNNFIRWGWQISSVIIIMGLIWLPPKIGIAQIVEGEWAIETLSKEGFLEFLTPEEPIDNEEVVIIFRKNKKYVFHLPQQKLSFVLHENSVNSYRSRTFHPKFQKVTLRLTMGEGKFEASLVFQRRYANDINGHYESRILGYYGLPPSPMPTHCFVGEWEAERWNFEVFSRKVDHINFKVLVRDEPNGTILSIPEKGIEFKAVRLRQNWLKADTFPPGGKIDIKFSKNSFSGEIRYQEHMNAFKIKGRRPENYVLPATTNSLPADDELSPANLVRPDESRMPSDEAFLVLENLERLRAKIRGEAFELSVDTVEDALEKFGKTEPSPRTTEYVEKCE